ncbi:MAG: hypothetical protein RIQ94_795 [Pseudomonadota bacterium]|jgi:hypothetical protein
MSTTVDGVLLELSVILRLYLLSSNRLDILNGLEFFIVLKIGPSSNGFVYV